ncbi:MAG: hypothetical protein QOG05_5203, partial [Streptosporangiaceae bacterium]|nr:hypothetical protein [Streptosporangiaceae bacterium]
RNVSVTSVPGGSSMSSHGPPAAASRPVIPTSSLMYSVCVPGHPGAAHVYPNAAMGEPITGSGPAAAPPPRPAPPPRRPAAVDSAA